MKLTEIGFLLESYGRAQTAARAFAEALDTMTSSMHGNQAICSQWGALERRFETLKDTMMQIDNAYSRLGGEALSARMREISNSKRK